MWFGTVHDEIVADEIVANEMMLALTLRKYLKSEGKELKDMQWHCRSKWEIKRSRVFLPEHIVSCFWCSVSLVRSRGSGGQRPNIL